MHRMCVYIESVWFPRSERKFAARLPLKFEQAQGQSAGASALFDDLSMVLDSGAWDVLGHFGRLYVPKP